MLNNLLNKSKIILILAFLIATLPTGLAHADAIVKSFAAKSPIAPGYVVAAAKDNPNFVELAPAADPSRIFGVVVDQATAPITLQSPSQNTFVATSGSYPMLVSLEYGSIKPGDYLSLATSDGLAAKASVKQDFVVAQAEQSFDGSSGVQFNDKNWAVGRIKAQIMPGKNPLIKNESAITRQLKQLASAIVGKPVTTARIYAAMSIFVLTLLLSVGLIWGGIRTSIISIGRNPLSKHSILQGLAQVVTVSILIFGGGLLTIYLLLKL